jgi:lipopolysaccharide cholinephosphotransferase
MSEQQNRIEEAHGTAFASHQTECERIVSEGILPADFFKPETICDFYVDETRKKIWAVELDLLIKFHAICKKYGLKYFLAFGSLLGAVRHHGLIPWDDDMDVCMPRADYEKFLKVAPKELSEPYSFSAPGMDNDYFLSFAKLRNSRTSAVSLAYRYNKYNHGMFVDIFVIDNTSLETVEEDYNQFKYLILENTANMRRANLKPSQADLDRINAFVPRDPMLVNDEMNALFTKYNSAETEYQMVTGIGVYGYKKVIYRKQDIEEIIPFTMYGHEFYIPKNYDLVLRTTYGDYMQFPPVEERGKWHEGLIFDPDVAYPETIKRLIAQDN